jgi:cytochrome P450
MAAYVNDAYRPEKLTTLFGRDHIFTFGGAGDAAPVGALAWFVLALLLVHLLWAVAKRQLKKRHPEET